MKEAIWYDEMLITESIDHVQISRIYLVINVLCSRCLLHPVTEKSTKARYFIIIHI